MKKLLILCGILLPLFLSSGTVKKLDIKLKKVKLKKTMLITSTFYNPDSSQTDSRPFETASGKIIDTNLLKSGKLKWVAISRSLLKRYGGHFRYGDSIMIHNAGIFSGKYMIVDCMSNKYKCKMDILVHKNKNYLCTKLRKKLRITW